MATIQFSFMSKSLSRIVPVTAVIPVEEGAPGAPKPPEKFPAVYLLHGYTGICTDWILGTRINALAQQYGVAFFCPSGENSFYLDDEVGCNYYATYLAKDLLNVTRRMFPLSDKKDDTVIAGFSMGGYGALRNGLFYNDIYGGIFAFSSALLMDKLLAMQPGEIDMLGKTTEYYARLFGNLSELPGSDKDISTLAKKCVEKQGRLPNMYMACGTEDFGIGTNRALGKEMGTLPGKILFEEWPGKHDWAFWDVAVEKALEWWTEK